MNINVDLRLTLQLSPALERLLRGILRLEAMNMADKQTILDNLNRVRDEVARQTTVNASVKALLSQQATSLTDLSAQIAALKAGSVTQEDIDNISGQLKAHADALTANDDDLASAVTANTPAA